MSDYGWSSSVVDALVEIDATPLVVRISAIDALVPMSDGRTQVVLRGGDSVMTDATVEDIVAVLTRAVKGPGPVSVPK